MNPFLTKSKNPLLRLLLTPRNLIPTLALLFLLFLRSDRTSYPSLSSANPVLLHVNHPAADYRNQAYGLDDQQQHPLGQIQTEINPNQSQLHQPYRKHEQNCLPYILFDKPVKTGSTAITAALRSYLATQHADYIPCDMLTCHPLASDVCLGNAPKLHMINHLPSNTSLIDCLRDQGYYIVTSIREPYERWRSAYAFNKKTSRSHYGVHHTAPFEHFMAKVPDCSLLHYYDNLGPHCAGPIDTRVADIVDRFDEIIDLYADTGGDVYSRIRPWLKRKNVSPKVHMEGFVDLKRMDPERYLYQQLKRRAASLPKPRRSLCSNVRTLL